MMRFLNKRQKRKKQPKKHSPHNPKLSSAKAPLGAADVDILRHYIAPTGARPNVDKVSALADMSLVYRRHRQRREKKESRRRVKNKSWAGV